MPYDIIIVGGAPGAGKTSILSILKEKLNGVHIDAGWLRQFHLNQSWTNASKKEEQMSFENLVFIIKNYLKNNYTNIIIDDLLYQRVAKLERIFKNKKLIIIAFTLDEKEHKRRITHPTRDSGFKDFKKAREFDNQWRECDIPRTIKIDITKYSVNRAVEKVLEVLNE